MKKTVFSIYIILFLFSQLFGQKQDDSPIFMDPYPDRSLSEETFSPVVVSTFIGGTKTDDAYEPSIALDQNGNIYITGFTLSQDFPITKNAYDIDFNGGTTDRFVSKLSNNLKALLSSTFIGGKGLSSPYIGGNGDELGHAIAIDSEGSVYIAGYTESPDFPVTDGAYDKSFNGGRDVYVSKFDSNLTRLLASTFIGGTGDEGYKWPRIDMAIDKRGDIYVVGLTHSVDFPINLSAFDKTFNGGPEGGDIFIVKISNNLSKLLGSTYLGGGHDEWRASITIDAKKNVIVCGETESMDFPTTPGVYAQRMNVMKDIFISKFNSDLTKLKASTLFGGSDQDEALSIEISKQGNIYITGYTQSKDFPTTSNAYRRKWSGGHRDAYLATFNESLNKLMASTLFGGSDRDISRDLVLDRAGNVYVTGITLSSDFPVTKNILNKNFTRGLDFFISKFDMNLERVLMSSVFGGSKRDESCCILLDHGGNIYVAGKTTSPDFPVTHDAYDITFNGGFNDCFLFKFTEER